MIVLRVTPCVHAQQIADVLVKNDDGVVHSLAKGTFNPDRPTDVIQDFSSYPGGPLKKMLMVSNT